MTTLISRDGSRIVLTPKETVDRHPMIDAALVDAFADEHAGRRDAVAWAQTSIRSLLESDFLRSSIVKLRRACAGMVRHLLDRLGDDFVPTTPVDLDPVLDRIELRKCRRVIV